MMNKQELISTIKGQLQVEQYQLGGLMARCNEHDVAFDVDQDKGLILFPHLANHYLVIVDTVRGY